jgi:4-hydroxy-tetrahydrodipicolinate reductase
VIGSDSVSGLIVADSLEGVLSKTVANVALHTTNSYFDLFSSQVLSILEAGLDVVSTAEELSFPWLRNREAAAEIDAAAKRAGKTVLGTGVNPGFIMDSLPLALTAICQRVDRIDVTRVINASERRGPFQAKIGSGMSVEEFNTRMAEGRMGHVGLPESMGMLFDTLGRKLVRYEDGVEPVVAETLTKTDLFTVEPGRVKGLKQVARGFTEEGEFASLTFIAALGMDQDGDTIPRDHVERHQRRHLHRRDRGQRGPSSPCRRARTPDDARSADRHGPVTRRRRSSRPRSGCLLMIARDRLVPGLLPHQLPVLQQAAGV